MKKITYYLMLLSVIFAFHGCDEDDYTGVNITEDTREVKIKELSASLTGHIAVVNSKGEAITDADMGAKFYVVDNTEGGANSSSWTITKGAETITSDKGIEEVIFAKPGEATISLTSTRASDGQTATSTATLPINSIPLTAFISTNIDPVNDVIDIKSGDFILYNNATTGSPDGVEWAFEGGSPATSEEGTVNVQYQTTGVYDVTFTAKREDSPGNWVTDVVEKTDFINVVLRVANSLSAIATDNKIVVDFDEMYIWQIESCKL